MTTEIIIAMVLLSFSMSITPGPVNMLIISSGINYGFKKTFSFVSGATIGFTLLLIFIGFGFITVLENYPIFLKTLSIIGSLFIMYMGYKIITSIPTLGFENQENKTLKFYEGFLLQWLNPKAWIACVAGVSMFSQTTTHLIIFIVIYFILCYIALSFWAFFGDKASKFFYSKKRLKIFNIFMGILLIIPAVFLLFNNIFK